MFIRILLIITFSLIHFVVMRHAKFRVRGRHLYFGRTGRGVVDGMVIG